MYYSKDLGFIGEAEFAVLNTVNLLPHCKSKNFLQKHSRRLRILDMDYSAFKISSALRKGESENKIKPRNLWNNKMRKCKLLKLILNNLLLTLVLFPQGCKLEWVKTEDRRKIAHVKVCELATYTDKLIKRKLVAGCCGTVSGQLLSAVDHFKGLECFRYVVFVFVGLSFSFSSKWLFLTAKQSFASSSSIPSAPLYTDKFVFRP